MPASRWAQDCKRLIIRLLRAKLEIGYFENQSDGNREM